jgi:hypothetical protein
VRTGARGGGRAQLEHDRGDEPGALATAPFGPPQRALSLAFPRAVLERAAQP